MKVKFDDQILTQDVNIDSACSGIDSRLLNMPTLEPSDAIYLNKVIATLKLGSCPFAYDCSGYSCHPGIFNYGIDAKPLETNGFVGDLIESDSLMTYVSHVTTLSKNNFSESPLTTWTNAGLGGVKDTVCLRDNTSPGFLRLFPAKSLYFTAEKQNLVSGGDLIVFISYDIVTLTTSEQAALFQACGGCC